MSFKPFHVYEIDARHPLGNAIPFNYFLCMTLPRRVASSVKYNIVGYPVLVGRDHHRNHPLRQPLLGQGEKRVETYSDLEVPGELYLAIDLLQPLNQDILLPTSRGEILESEKKELVEKLVDFLAIDASFLR